LSQLPLIRADDRVTDGQHRVYPSNRPDRLQYRVAEFNLPGGRGFAGIGTLRASQDRPWLIWASNQAGRSRDDPAQLGPGLASGWPRFVLRDHASGHHPRRRRSSLPGPEGRWPDHHRRCADGRYRFRSPSGGYGAATHRRVLLAEILFRHHHPRSAQISVSCPAGTGRVWA
jgi:hypothetical protein